MIAISTAIHMKKNKSFGPCIRAIFHTYASYNVNPCDIFENMTFSPIFNQELEQGKLMAAVDSRKLSPKNVYTVVLCNRLKFGKMSREDLLCTKNKKMYIKSLIVGAL